MTSDDSDEMVRRLDAGIARLRAHIPATRPEPKPAELRDLLCPACSGPLVAGALRVPQWLLLMPHITCMLDPRGEFEDGTGERAKVPVLADGPAYRCPSCRLLVIPNA